MCGGLVIGFCCDWIGECVDVGWFGDLYIGLDEIGVEEIEGVVLVIFGVV